MQAEGSSNDHDLGLFSIGEGAADSAAGRQSVGLYHLAWEVDTLQDLADISVRLSERSALVGATDHGTTKALYGKDPDGIEFEVSWLVPADLITEDVVMTAQRLDLAKEVERYGNDTLGGIGISRPRPVEA
jgi:catechol-2,3-dioxygenase